MIEMIKKRVASWAHPLASMLRSHRVLLLVMLFILLQVGIWWHGPQMTVASWQPLATLLARGLASTALTLLFVFSWGVGQWRRLQHYLSEQAHQQQLQDDPYLQHEEQQNHELNQMLEQLKTSLNRDNYTYALPWYLVMGLTGTGKSSLIERSGQSFTFSTVLRATGRRSANPHSFDWWIGEQAVLIDPDSALLNWQQDQEETALPRRLWLYFVQWLAKNRPQRPLNGVVLILDMAELASGNEQESSRGAIILRARLRELMETFSTRLPVYVMLTRCDRLYGFESFLRHCTQDECNSPLGFGFNLADSQGDQWQEAFTGQYRQWLSRIRHRMSLAMADSPEEERVALYSFYRQMSGLLPVLSNTLREVLGSDPFSTPALVRGLYLTSVFQQDSEQDPFAVAAARHYHLPAPVPTERVRTQARACFTHQLFERVVYPEAGLAASSARVVADHRHLVNLSMAACIIAGLLLLGGWHRYYIKNNQQADAVLAKVNQYRELHQSDDNALAALGPLRDATLEFGVFREQPRYLADLGLYQGHFIGPEVERTYLNQLETRFLPSLMTDVAAQLASAESDQETMVALRVLQMMVDQDGRYQRTVQNHFQKRWQTLYPGDRVTQEQLMQHLDYAMAHTDLAAARAAGDAGVEAILAPYDGIIVRAREQLGTRPVEERIYSDLKERSPSVLGAPIDLANAIGPSFDLIFSRPEPDAARIPRLLTRQGLESYFIPQVETLAGLALVDSWVLGQGRPDFSEEDEQALREKLNNRYVADYADSWHRALQQLEIRHFPDIESAVLTLDALGNSARPLNRLLNEITANTLLFPPLPDEDTAAREALLASPRQRLAALVDHQFAALNRLADSNASQNNYMDEVTVVIDQLRAYMLNISSAANVGSAALAATKARVSLQNADPIYQMQRVASGLPAPFDRLLRAVAEDSWQVIRQEAIQHIETLWFQDVYSVWSQQLAGRYPFNPDSAVDVALADFEAFFAPEGTLARFHQEHLALFLDNGNRLGETVKGESLIRPDVLAQLERADAIRGAFFNRKGVLDVAFTLEPQELSANKRRSVLKLNGQFVEYSHGPRRPVALVWPNDQQDNTTTGLTLVPVAFNQSPRSLSLSGPWAFFRLLQHGEITGKTATRVNYRFTLDEGSMTWQLRAESDDNPFTSNRFQHFTLPETLY